MSEEIKDLCKSCTFAFNACWIALILDGLAEGSIDSENINVWVVKCEDHRLPKEPTDVPK